jgi:AbrB family looped-hinge helix DNA binding protein
MKAIVSARGRVTIPKPLRARFGLEPGSVLEFQAEGGRLVAHKISEGTGIDAAYRTLSMDESVDVFIESIRGR